MHITSNADWDEEHPAGTLLDDILWAEFWSYADYIRSGYETGGGNNVQMLVEDLKADDMQMIRDYVIIYFTKTPTIDPIHTLTVEWTTVEGGGQDRLAHLPAAGQCERITCVQSRTI